MVKGMSLLIKSEASALGFSFGVRTQTEMNIRFVKGMLKVVSKVKVLKGF